ncbi:MAG: acetyltransferase [Lachnospiraceae bacterium]|nr:acetyltransferase [Lachnospiraceae bacterium]
MKKKLMILGAGGYGRVIAECAELSGQYSEFVFLDDVEPTEQLSYPYYGKLDKVYDYVDEYDIAIAIGDGRIREFWITELEKKGANLPNIIHPNATVSPGAKLGIGTVVMPGAVINTGTLIGKGVIVNTASSIDHDCIVGDYCHVAVGAHLCGTVILDTHIWVGAGSIVIQNIRVCKDCILGAGTVIVKDIDVAGTYVGVPGVRK